MTPAPPMVTAAKQALDARLAWDDGQDEYHARVDRLDTLQAGGGPGYTFWRLATAAIRQAGSPERVNWSAVELQTIQCSIGRNGQPAELVGTLLCQHSPVAATKAQQTALLALLHQLAPALEKSYQEAQSNRARHPMDFDPAH